MPTETTKKIVYVVAPSGAGKSFTGDYLAVVHGFEHVDGDYPMKHSHVPENYEVAKNWLVETKRDGRYEYAEEKKALWGPYFEKIANMTVEAVKSHDRVVLSHATFEQPARDLVIETLLNGGIRREQITIIQLTIDQTVLYGGHYERTKRQAEQTGLTITEACKAMPGFSDFEGEMTKEQFIDLAVANNFMGYDLMKDEPAAIRVDVSSRGVAHLDGIDAALGLRRNDNLTYEEICEKVAPLDVKRDADSAASGGLKKGMEIFREMFSLVNQKEPEEEKKEDEAEVEEMKRCRSSFSQDEQYLNRMRSITRSLPMLEEIRTTLYM